MKKRILLLLCTLFALSPLAAMVQKLGTKAVGELTIECGKPEGWQISATLTEEQGREVVTLKMVSREAKQPPRVRVEFTTPQCNTHHLWHSGNRDRARLRPDWSTGYGSSLAQDMPLYAFINENNRNCLTIATDEASDRSTVSSDCAKRKPCCADVWSSLSLPKPR